MSKNPSEDDTWAYNELRQLLLGPELKKLEELTERLESPEKFSSDIGEVLPQAMLKSAQQGEKLTEAMVPTVEEIVRLSIKRDINKFANALFPVIGPAIRKSISETMRQMLQSLNQVLEHGLSWQGLKWRIESIRTGIPFAQIVMLNSLEYRVEQVFLIHRKTGILLNHVKQEDSINHNADMVSSMLTAIGDFVGDSFDVDNRQELDSIQVGDFSILIEQGPGAILAVASRGNAPSSLRNIMLQTMEEIQTRLATELENFKGDTQPFDSCSEQLLPCMLQSQPGKQQKKLPLKIKLIWIVVIILFFYWIASNIYLSIQQQDYINLLQKEPGYIITQLSNEGDSISIKGLKDPLARDPRKFIALTTLNPEDVYLQFDPFQSLDEAFVKQRLVKMLNLPVNASMHLQHGLLAIKGFASEHKKNDIQLIAPLIAGIDNIDLSGLKSTIDLSPLNAPDSIELSVDINTGKLTSKGTAQSSWAKFAREKIASIEGLKSYDDSQVKGLFDISVFNAPASVSMTLKNKQLTITGEAATDWINSIKTVSRNYDEINEIDISQLQNSDERQLSATIESLQNEIILFDAALSFNYSANESFKRVADLVRKIIDSANKLSRPVKILIKGHTDSTGQFKDNVYLSLERADYVAQYLFNSGISPEYIAIKGMDAPVKKETSLDEQRYNRRVTFNVQR